MGSSETVVDVGLNQKDANKFGSNNDKMPEIKENFIDQPKALIIMAHGAGAGMDHPFMSNLAVGLSTRGFHVARFNFPYVSQGKKLPGSPKPDLLAWKEVVDKFSTEFCDLPIILSGKSYGGRIASHVLAENSYECVKGVIYFGFPLHAPGKVSRKRADHLTSIEIPQLFLQGTKDHLADIALMREVISEVDSATLVELEHADHSFKVPKMTGITPNEIISKLSKECEDWVDQHF